MILRRSPGRPVFPKVTHNNLHNKMSLKKKSQGYPEVTYNKLHIKMSLKKKSQGYPKVTYNNLHVKMSLKEESGVSEVTQNSLNKKFRYK